jgi:hypothetical protein
VSDFTDWELDGPVAVGACINCDAPADTECDEECDNHDFRQAEIDGVLEHTMTGDYCEACMGRCRYA